MERGLTQARNTIRGTTLFLAVALILAGGGCRKSDSSSSADFVARPSSGGAMAEKGRGVQFASLSFDEALSKAKTDETLVMIDVYTDWCGWCKKLDKDTYSDKDVEAKLTKDFIAVKVNPEKSQRNAKLSGDFGTTGYPHIVFVDANGKKVSEIDGYLPAARFLEQLNKISEKAMKK